MSAASTPPALAVTMSIDDTKEYVKILALAGDFKQIEDLFGSGWAAKARKFSDTAAVSVRAVPAVAATILVSPSAKVEPAASWRSSTPATAAREPPGSGSGPGTGTVPALSLAFDDIPTDAEAAAVALAAIESAMATADVYTAQVAAKVAQPPRKKVALTLLKVTDVAVVVAALPLPAFPLHSDDVDEDGFVRKRKTSEGGKRKKDVPRAPEGGEGSVDGAGGGAGVVKTAPKAKASRPRNAAPITAHGVFAAQTRTALKINEPTLTTAEIQAKVTLAWSQASPAEKLRCSNIAEPAKSAADAKAANAAVDDATGGAGLGAALPPLPPPPPPRPPTAKTAAFKPTAVPSRPRAGASSTSSSGATDENDLLCTSAQADPRADALRSAAARTASGRSVAAVRADGAIIEDCDGFSRERCFPRQRGRVDYRSYDVDKLGLKVAIILPSLIAWRSELIADGALGDDRAASAAAYLDSTRVLEALEPYFTATRSGVVFGTITTSRAAEGEWRELVISVCGVATRTDGVEWNYDDEGGGEGEGEVEVRVGPPSLHIPWLHPKSTLVNAPYMILASAYSKCPPSTMPPGTQMRMLFATATGRASVGEWHEGRVYALHPRLEDASRGWPLSRFRAVRVIWYDQLAEAANPWFMEATQVDCHLSPWELTTEKLPFVAKQVSAAFVTSTPALSDARAVLTHIEASEAASLFRSLPSRAELPGYYTRVARPLALDQCALRAARGDYDSAAGRGIFLLWADLRTIVVNAKAFNAPYTLFWRLADALEHECRRVKKAYTGYVEPQPLPTPLTAPAFFSPAGAGASAGSGAGAGTGSAQLPRARGAATPFDDGDAIDENEAMISSTMPVDFVDE